MILGLFILFVVYFFSMMALVYGFKKVDSNSLEENAASTCFSVIISFRNEGENLPELLDSIEKLKYPAHLFEIIFVNDASEDNSEAIISEAMEKSKFSIKLIQNNRISTSPKKDAITEAITKSKFEWIVTTDADCKIPPKWLYSFDYLIVNRQRKGMENKPVMICGPVKYESNGSLIEIFQQFDGLSLQTVTIGSFGFKNPILSNGANLAYTKNAFLKVNGFSGNDHIASGDDIFLLEKMKKIFPGQVHFLKGKEAIVSTKPQKSWKNMINQRIRWASKTSKQKSIASIFLGGLVFLVNISMLTLPILMIFKPENLTFYILIILFKTITDFIFLQQSSKFFNVKISIWKFPLQTFIYALIIFLVVLKSIRGNYSWKGRSF